ncbi:MAG: di-trans,poly-cis-decaprenylcistransferase [Betaproteobacteria bacterium]|nr:di-trans,poly-cis-decaprenylcistransferase [Betaproteobacteria bacterium]MBV9361706.1 di-trans,poly-cis-decaprenylcistransferase [Betaproteobacteria bacterium]
MSHASSTQGIPVHSDVPRHVAIILDGNGRWAKSRMLPRIAGHRRGLEAVRATIGNCADRGIEFLTLFAFSSENWRRPAEEVALLMQLFQLALTSEVERMHKNGVRLKVIGDIARFDPKIRKLIEQGEKRTAGNRRLTLTIAANYGGRWDLLQAINKIEKRPIDEAALAEHLSMSYAPEPDLFIRTGGEERISNFLLWQLAYTELYFTDTLWPDFDAEALDAAIASYRSRERRFGRTSDQVADSKRDKVA